MQCKTEGYVGKIEHLCRSTVLSAPLGLAADMYYGIVTTIPDSLVPCNLPPPLSILLTKHLPPHPKTIATSAAPFATDQIVCLSQYDGRAGPEYNASSTESLKYTAVTN
jgi:hypothetical protein